jgi:hypothetical protein
VNLGYQFGVQSLAETDMAPTTHRARWRYVLVGILLVTLAAPEALYRLELSRIPERPALPVPLLPALVLHAASLELLHTPSPGSGGMYPWTLIAGPGYLLLHPGAPGIGVNALAAKTLLVPRRRTHAMGVGECRIGHLGVSAPERRRGPIARAADDVVPPGRKRYRGSGATTPRGRGEARRSLRIRFVHARGTEERSRRIAGAARPDRPT